MKDFARKLMIAAPFVLVLVCGFTIEPAQSLATDIIVTAAPVYDPLAALQGKDRFPNGAQLLVVHAGQDSKPEPLVTGFADTADANISFDAKSVLFAGKQNSGDPWQIWELTFADHSLRKIVADANDAVLVRIRIVIEPAMAERKRARRYVAARVED